MIKVEPSVRLPLIITAAAFAWLFWEPMTTLLRDWWNDPEAGHGLLLGPLSVFLMYKSGLAKERAPQHALGLIVLSGAVVLRILSGLAAELFTMRMSLIGAFVGLTIFLWGLRQVRHWWLPVTLLVLSVPLPAVILTSLAFPLQLRASQFGAALLSWREIPVLLAGNIIHLPGGHQLFVTEACSGLRSLTALVSLGVLMGGLWLKHPAARTLLLVITVPVAMFINGIRVFLTGFLVYFVDPALGEGFMHLTEGWALFVISFGILGGITWVMGRGEGFISRRLKRTEAAA